MAGSIGGRVKEERGGGEGEEGRGFGGIGHRMVPLWGCGGAGGWGE